VKQQQRGEKFHPFPALFINHPSHWLSDKTGHPLNLQEGTLTRTFVPPPEGTRYYDLSAHPPGEANLLAIELIAYSNIPYRMPDDTWLYPSR
jgi:hypothetical protein